MLRLSNLRYDFYNFFQLMIDYDMPIDVAYKGKLYRVEVKDLNQTVPLRKSKYKRRDKIVDIQASKCPDCKKLMINGVCMNPKH